MIAEFTLPEKGVNLSGRIICLDSSEIRIELLTPENDLIRYVSERVDVLFVLKGSLRTLGTRLVKTDGTSATLEICDPVRKVYMRKYPRYLCALNVQFRPVREDGVKAPWREARCTDISVGGMCLEMRVGGEVAEKGEALINLADLWLDAVMKQKVQAKRIGGRLQNSNVADECRLESKPLHLRGSIRYSRPTDRGTLLLGFQFTGGYTADNLRLARIILDVFNSS